MITNTRVNRRNPQKDYTRTPLLHWLLALGVILALVLFCRYWLSLQTVKHVRIEGNLKNVDKPALQEAITAFLKEGMLHLPIKDIRQQVLKNKWVDDVRIQKRWPDTLHLLVTEQRPVAHWQKAAYLNYRGEAFFPQHIVEFDELPALSGPEGNGADVLGIYQHLSAIAASRGMRVASLDLDELGSYSATLNNGVLLALGSIGVEQNINTFAFIFDKHLMNVQQKIKSIDLRYGNGMAVAWRPAVDSTTTDLPQGGIYER